MLNKLAAFLRRYDMVSPGDRVTVAVSGGADSVALLFAMYLLRQTLNIELEAAHFNHGLRGEESDRDEEFVRTLCDRFDIRLHACRGRVEPGEKGLEAAARDARYAFFATLPGKIATAHTADDNAETVLMHLVRGTGLKGLGGIAPVRGSLIRPMLAVTRQEVVTFLAEWNLTHIEDSSNAGDDFLRNRLRHHVMPLLKAENPRLAQNMSAMALRLRQDEACLSQMAQPGTELRVDTLKAMHPALRNRTLEGFLKASGVGEPEASHIAQAEALVFSENPSAAAEFPGGVTITRRYDILARLDSGPPLKETGLPCPGTTRFAGWKITCAPAEEIVNNGGTFTVCPVGKITLRARAAGDTIRLSGGTKSLKKLFIDRKIPAAERCQIPVIADEAGILGVYQIGVNLDRAADTLPAVQIHIEKNI